MLTKKRLPWLIPISFAVLFAVLFLLLRQAPYKDIALEGSYKEYDYKSLKETATIIALVEPMDSLSKKNRTVVSNVNGALTDFYAKRRLKVLKVFKDADKNIGSSLSILERAAISDQNE